jgi:5-methylthioadenosine/S-adenosylhomocysteine deaminase
MGDRTLVAGNPVVVLGATGVIADGALVVEDGRVVDVGSREQLEGGEYSDRIGGPGHVVMPGFVNCHFHSDCALGRGLYDLIFERTNIRLHGGLGHIDENDIYTAVLRHLTLMIRGGQTGCTDMFYGRPSLPDFGCDAVLSAYKDAGMRVAFGLVSRDQNLYVHAPDEEFLGCLPPELADEVRASPMGYAWPVNDVFATLERLVARWHGHDDRIKIIAAPDWTPACSDELYGTSVRFAETYDTGLITHLLETRSEMIFSHQRYGKSAALRLAGLGVLNESSTLAHFVWADDRDIAVVTEAGAVVSNNPGSNLRLSAGICRMRDIIDAGGRVGFGTDGISVSDREDYFEELRLASLLARRPMGRIEEGRMSSRVLLDNAAASGAQAIGAPERLGSLEVGKDADLLVLRRDRIFGPAPRYDMRDPLDVILDRAFSGDIESVLIRGKVVMRDQKLTTVDEAGIHADYADAAANRLWRFATEQERIWGAELPVKVEPYLLEFYNRWESIDTGPGWQYNTVAGQTG